MGFKPTSVLPCYITSMWASLTCANARTHKHSDFNKDKVPTETQLSPWLRERKEVLYLSFACNISAASATPGRNTDMLTHTETANNEQVTELLFPNYTFIFPLYIGSDKASNAASLHLWTKSGNFWNTFAQMPPTYFSWKKQMSCYGEPNPSLEDMNLIAPNEQRQ